MIIILAVALDFSFGDPKNKYHPTAWIGKLIGRTIPIARNVNSTYEKINSIILVVSVTALVSFLLFSFDSIMKYFANLYINQVLELLIIGMVTILSGFLLKTTIAIKGIETHATKIMEALSRNDISDARAKLSMIVKRNTANLDKQHIISATLESISENIVDGITGPLFYFSIFGLIGAFVYRTMNTFDSMIGYKTEIFQSLGWFAANCDNILNYIPSRLTGLLMIISSGILGKNWQQSFHIMIRDASKTESPNAGYPMATMAGALDIKFEKLSHYVLGNGYSEITELHFKSAISIMKVTVLLFVGLLSIPMILLLSLVGWWSFV